MALLITTRIEIFDYEEYVINPELHVYMFTL